MIESLPEEECRICGGTGKRQPAPNIGPGNIECNGCRGKGRRESFDASYSFSEKNVKEFRDFLMDCGGFKIC
jgi:RecJ-like exonuclease